MLSQVGFLSFIGRFTTNMCKLITRIRQIYQIVWTSFVFSQVGHKPRFNQGWITNYTADQGGYSLQASLFVEFLFSFCLYICIFHLGVNLDHTLASGWFIDVAAIFVRLTKQINVNWGTAVFLDKIHYYVYFSTNLSKWCCIQGFMSKLSFF